MTHEEAHALAREKGASRLLVAIVRAILTPFFRLYFGLRLEGTEHIPAEGAAVIAPNHKSFSDAFFIAVGVRRPIRFMGKVELIAGPWGRLIVRLGMFPVRRGESDEEAMTTARMALEQGELLVIFPEGTRVRAPEGLGEPRRGAARLAIEAGAPMIPCAITGTERLRRGPLIRPGKVQVAFGEPIPVSELEPTPEAARELIEDVVWPVLTEEHRRLRDRKGVIAAAIAGAGIGGVLLARRRRK